jgi:hypothetical protein
MTSPVQHAGPAYETEAADCTSRQHRVMLFGRLVSTAEAAAKIGRTASLVRHAIRSGKWSDEYAKRAIETGTIQWSSREDIFLRKFYSKRQSAWIASRLGRDVAAVRSHANKMGLRSAYTTNRKWTSHDVEYVRHNYATVGAKQIAKHLGKSAASVTECAQRLGVKYEYFSPRFVDLFGSMVTRRDVAVFVGCSVSGVRAAILAGRYNDSWIVAMCRRATKRTAKMGRPNESPMR